MTQPTNRAGQLVHTFRQLIEYMRNSAEYLVPDEGERGLLNEQLDRALLLIDNNNQQAVCLVLLDMLAKLRDRVGDDIDTAVKSIASEYFGVLSKEAAETFAETCRDDIKQFYDIMCMIAKSME